MEYQLLGDIFFIPDSPFGRNGPKLDEVLSVPADSISSKIAPVSEAAAATTTGPKKVNNDNKDSKTFNNKNKDNQNEIFLYMSDIKVNSESKIEMYFSSLLATDHIKMIFLSFEKKKMAIVLNSVPFSSKYNQRF